VEVLSEVVSNRFRAGHGHLWETGSVELVVQSPHIRGESFTHVSEHELQLGESVEDSAGKHRKDMAAKLGLKAMGTRS
jgi:hypothetical protein